jgi:hypothetical protein
MIKYISIILVSLFIQTSPSQDPGANASKEMMLCDPENNSFQGGEEITYKIYYNLNFIWLSAGEVKFKVEDLGDHFKFSARGKTFNSYEWLFKADDYFESVVDKKSLLPVSFPTRNKGE